MILHVGSRNEEVNNTICKCERATIENSAPIIRHDCLSFFCFVYKYRSCKHDIKPYNECIQNAWDASGVLWKYLSFYIHLKFLRIIKLTNIHIHAVSWTLSFFFFFFNWSRWEENSNKWSWMKFIKMLSVNLILTSVKLVISFNNLS